MIKNIMKVLKGENEEIKTLRNFFYMEPESINIKTRILLIYKNMVFKLKKILPNKIMIKFKNPKKHTNYSNLLFFLNSIERLINNIYLDSSVKKIKVNIFFEKDMEIKNPKNYTIEINGSQRIRGFEKYKEYKDNLYMSFYLGKDLNTYNIYFNNDISTLDMLLKIIYIIELNNKNITLKHNRNFPQHYNEFMPNPLFFEVIDKFFLCEFLKYKSNVLKIIGNPKIVTNIDILRLNIKNIYLNSLKKHGILKLSENEYNKIDLTLNLLDLKDMLVVEMNKLTKEFFKDYLKIQKLCEFIHPNPLITIFNALTIKLHEINNREYVDNPQALNIYEDIIFYKVFLICKEIPFKARTYFFPLVYQVKYDETKKWIPYFIEIDEIRYREMCKIIKCDLSKQSMIFYGNSGTGKTYAITEQNKKEKNVRTHFLNLAINKNQLYLAIIDSILSLISIIISRSLQNYMEYNGDENKHFLKDYENVYFHHIIIDEFNRGNIIEEFSKLYYMFDKNENGFSSMNYVDTIDNKLNILDLLEKNTYIFKPSYNLLKLYNLDCEGKNEYTRFLSYIKDLMLYNNPDNYSEIKFYFNNIIEFMDNDKYEVPDRFPIFSPPNLKFTLAMNTVDVNVNQMDLMINRRFEFQYMPYHLDNIEEINKIQIIVNEKDERINWEIIQKAINKVIILNCHESKCLGYYFWKNKEVDFKTFKHKILFYLYNTVLNNSNIVYFNYNLKDDNNKKFFKNKSFEELLNENDIKNIFSKGIIKHIYPNEYKNEEEETGLIIEEDDNEL